ncbi:Uncharacterised protein [Mycobacteroides abscessus subsp. abscessus]|nr:Uncharacterised protein [Mycobacteroides abscessus subsp. abscessus]
MLSQCTPSWTSTSANWLVSVSVLELSLASAPCPRMRQPQSAHDGAISVMAHSRLSKVAVFSPQVTVKVL